MKFICRYDQNESTKIADEVASDFQNRLWKSIKYEDGYLRIGLRGVLWKKGVPFCGEWSKRPKIRIPISGISSKNPPLFSSVAKQGGIFTKNLQSQIPNFFSPAAGFRSLFWGFSRLARRRRKILSFYTSETRFPLENRGFYYQNTKMFASGGTS